MSRALAVVVAACVPAIAFADDEPPPAEPAPAPDATPPPANPEVPTPEQLADQLDDLDQRTRDLERGQRMNDSTREQVQTLLPLRRYITAFVDVGAFAVGGDGTGIRSDFFHASYPGYRNTVAGQWVFQGDPFTTMINSLGEPADTGASREVTVDTIDSGGHASFIVNSVGLAIGKDVGKGFAISALAQLLPRSGPDLVEVSFAHVDYRPLPEVDLVLEAGKIDSVLGVEYRSQDAPRRVGVTPSLICRYTCGRPLGVDARLVNGRLSASASITNGDNFDERFEPKPQLKASRYPTAAAHLQWMLPVGQGLEVGASGAVGPQDHQPRSAIHQWHVGVDASLREFHDWNTVFEYVQGKQQGSTTGDPEADRMLGIERPACDVADCLTYKGAYLLVDRRVTAWLRPYARVDWRDAVHQRGAEFVYESHSLRGTLGARFEVTSRIVGKVEYSWNHELGVPQFPHDVITSSIVVSTD
ncbi:MAG TPA: hypothetical protein VFQ53_41335 [Kofleriaceae bacterium]|nr:hypothetical protein [Kofleriaceae bacterium]